MQYVWMALLVLGIVGADQLTKYLTVANIPLYGQVEAIPGLFSLTYVRNTGAAWSAFQGMTWLFVLVFVAFAVFIVWEFSQKRMGFTALERWCLVAVFGGGLGNMIDRLRLGFVVDMIKTDFMDFPVFNVADCFISCGCIFLLAHLIFVNREFWKDGKK